METSVEVEIMEKIYLFYEAKFNLIDKLLIGTDE